jgi:hypothetical protein
VTFAALTTTIVVNSTFTWPKLLAAALVCASLALVVSMARDRTLAPWLLVAAVIGCTLGLLAHGASAFALPTVLIAAAWQFRRLSARDMWRSTGAGVAALATLYLPWMLFQRFVDPPGDRLLKWHLAGDMRITQESALATIQNSYEAIGLREAWDNKVANLSMVFDPDIFRGVLPLSTASRGERTNAEFYLTTNALGLSLIVLAALAVAFASRAISRKALPPQDRRLGAMCALTLPSLVLWCLVMFIPRSTFVHQGSHVWIVILLTCPVAWLAGNWPRMGWVLLAAQVVVAWVELGPSWEPNAVPDPLAALMLLGGVALAVWAHVGLARGAGSGAFSNTAPESSVATSGPPG